MPSNWGLVPRTLDYGREHANETALITLIILLMFLFTSVLMVKLHFRLVNNLKYKQGKKQLLKLLPMLTVIIVSLIVLFYFVNIGVQSDRIWQADYFIAFTFNFCIMIISFASYVSTTTVMQTETKRVSMPIKRRKLTQGIINGMFKISFFFFWVFLLTPYYVLCVGYGQTLAGGGYAYLSMFIFLFMCFVCFFTFGRSPLAPLLPTVVLWGACISYFDVFFAMGYGVAWNGTGFILTIASLLFGFGFLNFLEPKIHGMKGLTAMLYVLFLWIIILGVWFFLWGYYGSNFAGTNYESFHWKSFIPSEKN